MEEHALAFRDISLDSGTSFFASLSHHCEEGPPASLSSLFPISTKCIITIEVYVRIPQYGRAGGVEVDPSSSSSSSSAAAAAAAALESRLLAQGHEEPMERPHAEDGHRKICPDIRDIRAKVQL